MRRIALVLAVLLLLSSLAGCAQSQISQEDYDALQAQYDALREEHDQTVQDLQAAEKAAQEAEDQLAAAEETIAALQAAAQETEGEEPGETAEPAGTEEEAETASEEGETIDISETEIRGGTNQADAVQIPLNTKVYGTLRDSKNMYGLFHTNDHSGSSYRIMVDNKLPDDDGTNDNVRVRFFVYDEYGTEYADGSAYSNGIVSTTAAENLSPDTDYYIRLVVMHPRWEETRDTTVKFALTVRASEGQDEGVATTSDLVSAAAAPDDAGNITPGDNQDSAALIPTDTAIPGTLADGLGDWFAFTTDADANSHYLLSTTNKTTEDVRVRWYIYDEFGSSIADGSAYNDGVTATAALPELAPSTTYYARFIVMHPRWEETRSTAVDYTFIIQHESDTPDTDAAGETSSMVFDKPFELTATQVRFVANKAVFIDEAEAREALAPVAEIILAHPDHPVLLAGTTATYGAQEGCVRLSNQRADAVKDLLVREFGVPEEQLLTVGLGYEADPFTRGRDRDANGNFVETEGVKNRRVVVLDAEDPVARQILGN